MRGLVRLMIPSTGEIKEFNLHGVERSDFGDWPWEINAVQAAANLLPHLVEALEAAAEGDATVDVEIVFKSTVVPS